MPLARAVGRAMMTRMLPGWLNQGRSVTALYRHFVAEGAGYRKQTFLKDAREITGLMKKEKAVRALSSQVIPTKAHMVEMDLRRARRYRVFGRARYFDTWEDTESEQPISFYTDTLESKSDWEQRWSEEFQSDEKYERYHLRGMQITAIEHQKGAPY